MAWNQSSIVLFARGWKPRVEEHEFAQSHSGRPLQVVGRERDESCFSVLLHVEVVAKWFLKRGFRVSWCPYVFERGEIRTPFGKEPEIEVHLGREDWELADVYLRFTLTPSCSVRWARWGKFVENLCCNWGLRIADPEAWSLVDGSEALRILESTSQWQEFRERFGWPVVC